MIETDSSKQHIHIAGVDNHIVNTISFSTCGVKLFPLNSKPVIELYNSAMACNAFDTAIDPKIA